MKYEKIKYLGKKMPLTINKNVESLSYGNLNESTLLKKGETVYFNSFIGYEENIQFISAITENDKKIALSQDMVEMKTIPLPIDNVKPFENVKDIKVGMEVLTLDAEVSEIGAGLIVKVIAIDSVYDDGSALLLVENQFGARETIGLHEISPYDNGQMTRKRALELGVEALYYLSESDLSRYFEDKTDEESRKIILEAVKVLESLKERV